MSDVDVHAGWHPDPHGRFEYRYWDGTQWTEHVSTAGATFADPAVGARATAASGAASGILARRRLARRERAGAQEEFESVVQQAVAGDPAALDRLPNAVADARRHYKERDFHAGRLAAARAVIGNAIHDGVLEANDEAHISRFLGAFGLRISDIDAVDPVLAEDLAIARINSGRLPKITDPGVMLRSQETAHGTFPVHLMKEVAVRQWQGGTSGVSIPIGLGVRYRAGSVRGRSVVVGSTLVAADSGLLAVTSRRTLFTGTKKTLEFRHDRLVGLQQYTDGLRLNVSNRQTASLFTFAEGSRPPIAVALIAHFVAHA